MSSCPLLNMGHPFSFPSADCEKNKLLVCGMCERCVHYSLGGCHTCPATPECVFFETQYALDWSCSMRAPEDFRLQGPHEIAHNPHGNMRVCRHSTVLCKSKSSKGAAGTACIVSLRQSCWQRWHQRQVHGGSTHAAAWCWQSPKLGPKDMPHNCQVAMQCHVVASPFWVPSVSSQREQSIP